MVLQMDEVSNKRRENYLSKNSEIITSILNSVKNKDEILSNQESFFVDSLKTIQRMKELLQELYEDEIVVLQGVSDCYLTIFKVSNRRDFFDSLNQCLINYLGDGYKLTVENMIIPRSLSFTNGERELLLLNYSVGFVNLR